MTYRLTGTPNRHRLVHQELSSFFTPAQQHIYAGTRVPWSLETYPTEQTDNGRW